MRYLGNQGNICNTLYVNKHFRLAIGFVKFGTQGLKCFHVFNVLRDTLKTVRDPLNTNNLSIYNSNSDVIHQLNLSNEAEGMGVGK